MIAINRSIDSSGMVEGKCSKATEEYIIICRYTHMDMYAYISMYMYVYCIRM